MIETANGAFLVVIATVLWPSSHLRTRSLSSLCTWAPAAASSAPRCCNSFEGAATTGRTSRRAAATPTAARGRCDLCCTRRHSSRRLEAGAPALPRIDYELAIGCLCQAEAIVAEDAAGLGGDAGGGTCRGGDDGSLCGDDVAWRPLSSRRNGSRDASPSVDGGSDKGGPHGGRSAAERIACRFQSRATTMLERATEVVDHMATLVEPPPPPPPDSKNGASDARHLGAAADAARVAGRDCGGVGPLRLGVDAAIGRGAQGVRRAGCGGAGRRVRAVARGCCRRTSSCLRCAGTWAPPPSGSPTSR